MNWLITGIVAAGIGWLSVVGAQAQEPPPKEPPPPDQRLDEDFDDPLLPGDERRTPGRRQLQRPGPHRDGPPDGPPPPDGDRGPRRRDFGPEDQGPGPDGPPRGPGGRRPGPDGPGPGPGGPGRDGPEQDGPLMVPRGPHDDWHSLEKYDPEMFKVMKEERELERECFELAQKFRRAPTDEQAPIREMLQQRVARHFEMRQQRRMLEIKRLEAELQRLRESVERRTKAQESIVNDRVSMLLGLDEGF